MELRVLHAAAYQHTWYGKWGYTFGRGPFNISRRTWRSTVSSVHNTPMAAILADFENCIADRRMLDIIDRYQVAISTEPHGTSTKLSLKAAASSTGLIIERDPIDCLTSVCQGFYCASTCA